MDLPVPKAIPLTQSRQCTKNKSSLGNFKHLSTSAIYEASKQRDDAEMFDISIKCVSKMFNQWLEWPPIKLCKSDRGFIAWSGYATCRCQCLSYQFIYLHKNSHKRFAKNSNAFVCLCFVFFDEMMNK